MTARRAATGVSVVLVVVALLLALAPGDRVVARLRLHADPREVAVQCGLLGGSTRSEWGEAANRLCAPVESSRYLRGGLALFAAGVAMAFRSRRVGSLLGMAGGVVAVLGLAGDLTGDDIPRLVTGADEALAAVAPADVVDAFEDLELRDVVQEERWIVVDAGVADVRAALAEHGWTTGDVPEQFSGGWVQGRGTAGTDFVEVGTYGDVTQARADTGANGRRLLGTDLADDLTVVHLKPG